MNGEGYKLGTLPGHEQEMTYDQLCSTPPQNLFRQLGQIGQFCSTRCVCTGAVCVCANAGGGETEMNRWSNRWSGETEMVKQMVRLRPLCMGGEQMVSQTDGPT